MNPCANVAGLRDSQVMTLIQIEARIEDARSRRKAAILNANRIIRIIERNENENQNRDTE